MREKLPEIAPEADRALTAIRGVIDGLMTSAFIDTLTTLFNHAALEKFEGLHDRTHTFGAVFVDLTGFKEINDRYGHEAGDAGLSATGRELAKIAADYEARVFRRGGDEFVLLTKDAGDARRCARDVAAAFGHGYHFPFQDQDRSLRAAVGFSLRQDNETTLRKLIDQADAACRVAKVQGSQKAVEWLPALSHAMPSELRRRCGKCKATAALIIPAASRRSGSLSRCPNCNATYSEGARTRDKRPRRRGRKRTR